MLKSGFLKFLAKLKYLIFFYPLMGKYKLTIEMDSEDVYSELKKEAQLQGISLEDLHRQIYKTYFAMRILVRDRNSKVIIIRDGVESVIREDGFNTLDEILEE